MWNRLLSHGSVLPIPAYWRYVTASAKPGTCLLSTHAIANTRAVWVKRGVCSADSLINIALCCLGVLPGLLHAWYIILQYPEDHEQYQRVADGERGDNQGTTYYVITHDQPGRRQGQPGYGTVANTPSGGQFPGQQTGGVGSFAGQQQGNVKAAKGVSGPAQNGTGEEGSSSQPAGPPPTYADAIKAPGDHKVQKP